MNPIEVEIQRHRFQSIAEEMGVVLQQTAFSANVKERLDFSCAVTDGHGQMIAQAAHIPVHLGSCHLTASYVLSELELNPGDIVIVNDPFRGGTHLPDVTLFQPVFLGTEKKASFGVICRAHHADVGGGVPGSMGDFDEIYKEGLIIPPVKIVVGGRRQDDIERFILANVRTPRERAGDLAAQIAAVERGARRIEESVRRYGKGQLLAAGSALLDRAEKAMRALIAEIPDGRHSFIDYLDGEDSEKIAVCIDVKGDQLSVDFAGSSATVPAAVNAHEAITLSCVFYCLRCLGSADLPTNSGILRPVELVLPRNSVVSAEHPAAVAAGNVETSQRIVDVIFGALAAAFPGHIPAASQGTMNNVSFGGKDAVGRPFTYFETLAGGLGAGPKNRGADGMHSHMTNTRNTPIEAFEAAFPLRIETYCLRRHSGGRGRYDGGEGIIREYRALVPMTASILTSRRHSAAWGLSGGSAGMPGKNILIRDGKKKVLANRAQFEMQVGDLLRLETPGGGAYGSRE